MGNLEHWKIVAYSDAAFANLTDGRSSGGYIIFLVGSNNKYKLIAWQSECIKFGKSILAAEILAMVEDTEDTFL